MRNRKIGKKYTLPNKYLLIIFGIALVGGAFFYYTYFNKKLSFQRNDYIISPFKTIKISVINDLHARAIQKKGEKMRLMYDYQRPLTDFFIHANNFSPDLVVANGDMIDGTKQTPENAMRELKFIRESFDQNFSMQKFWTIGNHELRALNRDQWQDGLGIDYNDYAFENDAYKIIFLDSAFGTGGAGNEIEGASSGLLLSDKQLSWLRQELENSNKTKIIFMHFPPLIGDDVKPGYLPIGTEQLQQIFSENNVATVISAHVENTLHKRIGGVDYYVLPGIFKNSLYENVFARIRMINDKAFVTITFKDESGYYKSKRVE